MAVEPSRVETIAPGEIGAVSAARCFFPLDFAGQAPHTVCLGAEPGGIGHGVVMADQDNRVLFAAAWRLAAGPGKGPAARIWGDQAIILPGRLVHIGGGVSGGGDEGGILGVGDCRFGDAVGGRAQGLSGALAVVPAVFAGDAVAIGGLVESVGRLALGGVGPGDERPRRTGVQEWRDIAFVAAAGDGL